MSRNHHAVESWKHCPHAAVLDVRASVAGRLPQNEQIAPFGTVGKSHLQTRLMNFIVLLFTTSLLSLQSVVSAVSLLTISAFALCLIGCSSPKASRPTPRAVVMPPSPFVASQFKTGASSTEQEARSVIAPPPAPRVMGWTWTYDQPMPVENIVFEFFSTTNLDAPQWTKHGETNQPVYWFAADKPQEFFICRASNTVTGLVSEWNK